MVDDFGYDADKLKQLENMAIRDLREKETKRHAKELTKYLNFEDVDDFTQAGFEEKNFSNPGSASQVSSKTSQNGDSES